MERPTSLTFELIARCCIPEEVRRTASHDELAEQVLRVTKLRLDSQNISKLDNLECLGRVTYAFFQHNAIEQIENLEFLPHLRFLALHDNKITNVAGLNHLKELRFLDLSDNRIETFDVNELPKSLRYLKMSGNPCASKPGYRQRIIHALPVLRELDDVELTEEEKLMQPDGSDREDSDSELDSSEESSGSDEAEFLEPAKTEGSPVDIIERTAASAFDELRTMARKALGRIRAEQ